jgi:tetratricopeptide (TPR) repeat protein
MAGTEAVAMSEVVPLLKFTPSAQDPAVLETITVQRQSLIARLVEVALDDSGARHQLLVGPRGIGKTHMLSLLASRVRTEVDPGAVVLAWLEEDPWSIGSYEKFLAAIVARVAEERSDQELAQRAGALHASRDGSGREAEEVLRSAIGDARLVLLVENLDDVFRRIGANGQERFRAFAEDWQKLLIVATAPQLFEGVQLHESPFYGFFAISHLDELSVDSASELMRRVAILRGDADLAKFLGEDVARQRIAAIEALAGGHPRIWLLLSGCVSIEAIDDLVPLFLEALDDLTPYYQDRLRELGDQQQEIVVLLGEGEGALSNRDLSERSGIAQNQIATVLKQLSERGYVRRAEIPADLASGDARMSFWELREPMMRLCLDVKQARGRPLRMVVEFLRAWYGPRLLDELATLPTSAELATSYVSEAFRTFDETLPFDDLLEGSSGEIVARAELGLSLSPERMELRVAKVAGLLMDHRRREALEELESVLSGDEGGLLGTAFGLLLGVVGVAGSGDRESLADGLVEVSRGLPEHPGTLAAVALGLSSLGRYEEAAEVYPRAVELLPDVVLVLSGYRQTLIALGRDEAALNVLDRELALAPDRAAAHASRGAVLRRMGRLEEAVSALERARELDPENPRYAGSLANVLGTLKRLPQALDILDQALESSPDELSLHVYRAVVLEGLGRSKEALEAVTLAVEIGPEAAFLQGLLGQSLRNLGRLDEALVALTAAAELDPENLRIQDNLGAVLFRLGRFDEAVVAYRKAIELDPAESRMHWNAGLALLNLERFEEAVGELREAAAAELDNPGVQVDLGVALGLAGHPEEALEVFRSAAELEPANARLGNGEANLLRRLGRFAEAEEAIRRAINADAGESVPRFTLSEISLDRGDAEAGFAQLRDAMEVWNESRGTPPGEPELLCRILWDGSYGKAELATLIARVVALYEEFDAAEDLGRGVVASIAWMADPSSTVERSDSWADAWLSAPEIDDLKIPMRLLRAGAGWKRDRDRAHLLDLPVEQRKILVGLLEGDGASPSA